MKIIFSGVVVLFFSFVLGIDGASAEKLEPQQRVLSVHDLPKALQKATDFSVQNFLRNEGVDITNAINVLHADPNKYDKTEQPLDIALLDEGYIVTQTPGPLATFVVTRYGSMALNEKGALVIENLKVKNSVCPGSFNCDITIPEPILPPSATTWVKIRMNLINSFETAFTVLDAKGDSHAIIVDFTPSQANNFAVNVMDENRVVVASGELLFDSTGALYQQVGLKQIPPLMFDLDFSKSSSYNNLLNSVDRIEYDGFIAGRLASLEVQNQGSVLAHYTNEIAVNLGQIFFSKENQSDLTPYLPLYPGNFWTFKEHPERVRSVVVTRVLSGWLEKDAYRLPDAR